MIKRNNRGAVGTVFVSIMSVDQHKHAPYVVVDLASCDDGHWRGLGPEKRNGQKVMQGI